MVADLGCGPGNSTQILRSRWTDAEILGVDSSAEMIDAAKTSYPDQQWILAEVSQWNPATPFDLVYSNAALQWIADHQNLIPHLFTLVAPGGALAFRIPSSTYAAVRTLIHEVSRDTAWTNRMDVPRNILTIETPAFYYDALVDRASELDIWETEYFHVMESKAAIVDWIASTGLRPFLSALQNDVERESFLEQLHRRVEGTYKSQVDGKVLFQFRRTFVIAYR